MAHERSSRAPKNKLQLYKEFTKSLNIIFKTEPDDVNNNAAKKISQFCDSYMPKANGETQWVLPLDEEIPLHTLVVLAHSARPIRCIGEITKNEQCTKAIPLKHRYIVEKFMRRDIFAVDAEQQEGEDEDNDGGEGEAKDRKRSSSSKKPVRSKKRKVNTIMVECGKRQQQLISKKKGFWVIWKPSLEANIKTADIAQHMDTVLGWYTRYVEGMEKDPCPTYPRNPLDVTFEQFLLDQYPTPEWRKHTQEFRKTNKSNKGENYAAMTQAPPPPPPSTPRRGNLSPASSSCSVPEDDDVQVISKKQAKSKKKKRPQQSKKEKKRTISNEPTCELESSAQDLPLFDNEAFLNFMDKFKNPDLPKNDILDFEDLGDLPGLDLMSDVVSI